MTTSARISIFEYTDPVLFLRDQLALLKQNDPGVTLSFLAKRMGLEKPTVLTDWLKGKKPIRPRHFPLLKKVLNLDDTEETYFQAITLRRQAKSTEESAFFDRILSRLSPGSSFNNVIVEDSTIFSNWKILAVMFALEIPGVSSEKEMEVAFAGKISRSQISDCLNILVRNGLIVQDQDWFRPAVQEVTSKTDKPSPEVHGYYEQVLELAKDAITVDVRQREFQCFSVTLNDEDLPAFKEMIRDLRMKILSRSVHTPRPNSLYQVGIQLFPIARSGACRPAESQVESARSIYETQI